MNALIPSLASKCVTAMRTANVAISVSSMPRGIDLTNSNRNVRLVTDSSGSACGDDDDDTAKLVSPAQGFVECFALAPGPPQKNPHARRADGRVGLRIVISRILSPRRPQADPGATVIYLGDYYPELSRKRARAGGPEGFSCSVLHRAGFVLPPRLLSER